MERVAVKLSADEMQALLELVENQLFRVKFIDRRIPGYKENPEKLALAAAAVAVLRESFNKAKGFKATSVA